MNELNAAKNLFEAARQEAVVQIDNKRIEIENAKTELYELETGVLPLTDVTARINELIDREQSKFVGEHRLADLLRYNRRPDTCDVFRQDTRPLPNSHSVDLGGLLCFLIGPEIKKRFVKLAESLDLPEGPTAAERPAAIKQLAQKIRKLEAEEEALIVQAHDAGIVVARHPDAPAEAILEWKE